ncbi:ATP-binding protein [Nitrospira sp. Kam-Ns4a]
MSTLLSKDHPITERPFMLFQPFGRRPDGRMIYDLSGIVIRASVEHLEDVMSRRGGPEAGRLAVAEHVRRLNERIRDPAFHVTEEFLKNPWNGYSCEFSAFNGQFCLDISGDRRFNFHMAREKAISHLIQVLGRPFSVAQIYRMSAYFSQRYAKDAFLVEAISIGDSRGLLRMTFSERMCEHFGPYRRACAYLWCDAVKGYFAGVPERFHNLPPATAEDLRCIAEGDDYCEWEVTWSGERRRAWLLLGRGTAREPSQAIAAHLPPEAPVRTPADSGGAAGPHEIPMASEPLDLKPGGAFRRLLAAVARRILRSEIVQRERLVAEQVRALDARHVEMQEAYVQQQQLMADLQRRINQLTTLHNTGLVFTSILDREALLDTVLHTVVDKLRYDRAMISLFDRPRQVISETRILGVPPELAAFARTMEVPVQDPDSIEGTVLLKGEPVLLPDVREAWDRLHPLHRQLAQRLQAKSVISVPLRAKSEILGALTVERVGEPRLGQDDLNLIGTLAAQVAIALDNTNAYRQIEELIAGLEAKVRERTAQLERVNQELAAANDQLKQMDRLRSQFLSHVSHELRTPLTAIKGFVENMLGGLAGPLSEKQHTYLARVAANTHRLIRMIAELLEQSRIEAGKIELVPNEVDLRQCLAEAVEQLRPEALAKRHRLEVRGADAPLMVWADADRLIQIVTNLVHNAIKFTPEDGAITVEVAQADPQFARVTVRDTGAGIPPEALPRIFDPFFRAGAEQRVKSQGLGLGLAIVKTLVELHGGRITARSEPGQGTEFSFTVPLRPASRPARATPSGAGKRILVVDDDADIRKLLQDRLTAEGYCVETAADGLKALEALATRSFAGLILDIGMPELDGLQVLRRIRATDPAIPIIMVTASGAKEWAIQAMSLGAQAYLLKPFDAEQLKEMAARWFGAASAPIQPGPASPSG